MFAACDAVSRQVQGLASLASLASLAGLFWFWHGRKQVLGQGDEMLRKTLT